MPESKSSVGLGICGIGGYACGVADAVLRVGATAEPPLRLVAACDPNWQNLPDQVAVLRQANVAVLGDYNQLLERDDVDVVWVALPIDLHRPFTERALAAGKAVMCEKPAAGCVDDVDAMIAARDAAGREVLVGFQDAYLPATATIKRKLLEGVIGRVTHVTVHACGPRTDAYFSRNNWAGRIQRDGVWVLDSPANNAQAHDVNLALMLLGPTLHEAATPREIEAELYRTADIQNYDTFVTRTTLDSGVTLLILLTHACCESHTSVMQIHGERGHIRCVGRRCYTITTPEGEQTIEEDAEQLYLSMVHQLARTVAGTQVDDPPWATLENARQQTLLINGASEATPVVSVPPEHRIVATDSQGEKIQALRGIESAFEQCAAENKLLHELGRYDFTQPAGRFDLRGYRHFTGGKTPNSCGLTGRRSLDHQRAIGPQL